MLSFLRTHEKVTDDVGSVEYRFDATQPWRKGSLVVTDQRLLICRDDRPWWQFVAVCGAVTGVMGGAGALIAGVPGFLIFFLCGVGAGLRAPRLIFERSPRRNLEWALERSGFDAIREFKSGASRCLGFERDGLNRLEVHIANGLTHDAFLASAVGAGINDQRYFRNDYTTQSVDDFMR